MLLLFIIILCCLGLGVGLMLIGHDLFGDEPTTAPVPRDNDQQTLMTDIRHIDAEVGPEILSEIGTGLIINNARWSAPSAIVCKAALREAVASNIPRVFVIDHDLSDKLTDLFVVNGDRLCLGCGDLIYVVNGNIKNKSHVYLDPDQVRDWMRSTLAT